MHDKQSDVSCSAVQPQFKLCCGFAATDRSLTASKVLMSACGWRNNVMHGNLDSFVFMMHCRMCPVER